MNWTITYYNDALQNEILGLSKGFLARYIRYEVTP
jgi:ribonucleotide reductase beta subunit family protein with ferritin-like domain